MEDNKKYTILVVDDDEMLRGAIVFDLQRKGFTVLSADNGVTALELVKKNKIHLVLSDIRMPGESGVALLEKIRVHDPKIPVVLLMTGYADVSAEDCKKKGAKDVISKPFERNFLMESILKSLGLSETTNASKG